MRGWLITMIVVLAFSFQATAQEAPSVKVCWPLHFAGITVGVNNDSEVVRLLGEGIFRKNEGDTGGRIFVDKNRSATLHVIFYTDRIVGELTVSEGIGNLSKTEQKKAESSFFNLTEGFGNWHELFLGATQDDVIRNLGEPESKDEYGGWRYLTNCSCEIQDYFTIYFKNERINKVVFSAPAG